jgi:hypothetical protein
VSGCSGALFYPIFLWDKKSGNVKPDPCGHAQTNIDDLRLKLSKALFSVIRAFIRKKTRYFFIVIQKNN